VGTASFPGAVGRASVKDTAQGSGLFASTLKFLLEMTISKVASNPRHRLEG